jgi:aminopeptidase-like protein/aminoglycoside N3'-acetyltransferase
VTETYAPGDVASALRAAGASAGDVLFLHAGAGALGRMTGAAGPGDDHRTLLAALRSVVGEGGTILMPAYTFSFCRQEVFDADLTPALAGPWSPDAGFVEFFRRQPGVIRSRDPIHSVAGQGPEAASLLRDIPPTCFGDGSVFARLVGRDALICMLGLDLDEATVRHFSEELVGVPFRYRKLFTGVVRDRTGCHRLGWVYNVRILADNGYPDGRRLAREARAQGVARHAAVGAGSVVCARAGAFHWLTLDLLRRDPWATARGPAADPVAVEDARAGAGVAPVGLPPAASMEQMVDALWHLPRDIVSSGYDAALAALGSQVPMRVHEFLSGTECWSWIVPEKWACQEAWLETADGRRLFAYADNPLHVVSYSLPFEGEVTRAELLAHLHIHPRLPDAVPFAFKYYERDWGLCCSALQRDALTDDRYRVVIRTTSTLGTLKVGEVVLPGETEDTFVLCAHLCHPGMVNDDLAGVVVGVDVMRSLLRGPRRRHTYRLLIVPETIGSVAFLSRHPDLIARMRGGLFLEMLGRAIPHALQLSFAGDLEIDRSCARVLRALDPAAWIAPFRSLAGNDERQFNAPGVRVPMLALTRQLRPDHPDAPFREYHSSADTPEMVPAGVLAESRDLVLAMIDAWDRLEMPGNRFPGEICCSRYGLHIDFATDPEGHKALFDMLFLIDGTRSAETIAGLCSVPVATVRGLIEQLRLRGLLTDPPRGHDAG